jgi:hypothetical protein
MFGILPLSGDFRSHHYPDVNAVGYTYETGHFEDRTSWEWTWRQIRMGDVCKPLALSFDFVSAVLPDLSDLIFSIEVGGSKIVSVPVSVLKAIGSTTYRRMTNVIKFDFKTFMDCIPLISLGYHEIDYTLHSVSGNRISDSISHASMVYAMQYLPTERRRELVRIPRIEKPIQQLTTLRLDSENRAGLGNAGYCRGFLFEGDIDHIDSFRVSISNQYQDIGNEVLAIAEQLNDKCLFVPFNHFSNFRTNEYSNFEGSIHIHGAEDYISVNVRHNANIKVYAVTLNKFVTQTGFGALLFTFNSESSTSPQWEKEQVKPIIDPDRSDCPIMHEFISVSQKYATCTTCSHNFYLDALRDYFRTISRHKCPTCRSRWKDYTVYVNSLLESEEISSPVDIGENLVSDVE